MELSHMIVWIGFIAIMLFMVIFALKRMRKIKKARLEAQLNYQRIPDILFDLDCFSEYYLKKFELLKEEKLLLCCLMNVVPIIFYDDNEIENIIKLSRLLYYLDSIQDFIQEI